MSVLLRIVHVDNGELAERYAVPYQQHSILHVLFIRLTAHFKVRSLHRH